MDINKMSGKIKRLKFFQEMGNILLKERVAHFAKKFFVYSYICGPMYMQTNYGNMTCKPIKPLEL